MLDLAPHNPYGLRLSSPILTAAGCFGYGVEYARSVDFSHIGAIVTRSTSLRGRRGGRRQLIETPAGLLLAGAWPDPGLGYVLDHYAPTWAGWSTPVILSIVGANSEEYAALAAALEGIEGIAGVELNLAAHAEHAARITAAVRAATQLPILAKLPHGDIAQLGRAVADAGADVVTLFAPLRGSAADPDTGEMIQGDLVGPATRPLVLAALADAVTRLHTPIVACGGAGNAGDARQLLAAGATAVQLGSALLVNPLAAAQAGAALAAGI